MGLQLRSGCVCLALCLLAWTSAFGQNPQLPPVSSPAQQTPNPGTESPSGPATGTINGIVVDQSGALVAGARVTLTRQDMSQRQEVVSGPDGQFSFANVSPGPFQLTVVSTGFAPQSSSGTLRPGEIATVPQIMLAVAENVTEVVVGIPRTEIAAEQMKVEEQQRVLAAIPNFYVSYDPKAVPLSPKQKFTLAWKTVIDPFTFAVVAGTAGVQQAQDHFKEYGQGAAGYGKRFGAVYADTLTSTFIGSAILPSLLKQDPRYFYKGTGSVPSRTAYAIANAFVCKGDNGRWQVNYSGILGSLAAGGISNLYYPKNDREGFELTFENAGIGIGTTALTNILQEFLIRKLTPKAHAHDLPKPLEPAAAQ
ncbi:MAG TPA: carboxypeptidase-like regulatory domain-containing protein [Candidatus Acidoferrales bacterium]|nr:carboxypeptidase-like regulatory domain-containing protein [Candidatus Acidoferrales bacterium]